MARPQLEAFPGEGAVESNLLCFLLRGGLGRTHSVPCWVGGGEHILVLLWCH